MDYKSKDITIAQNQEDVSATDHEDGLLKQRSNVRHTSNASI